MKVQCPCGSKFDFEIQPEMLARPGKFICAGCGQDWSNYINGLVQKELIYGMPVVSQVPAPAPVVAAPAPEIAPPPEVVAAPYAPPPPAPVPVAPRVRLHTGGQNPAEAAAPVTDQRFCAKHPGQRPVEHCVVCQKPLCPKCMELFGYLCSPHCRQKADLQGIEVPEFAGQKSVMERHRWRKVGLVSAGICVLVVALLGGWIWYEWGLSRPHATFAFRFDEASYSGRSYICAPDQIVFLHGDTLARHDMKSKKEVWARQLIDKKMIDEEVEQTIKALHARQAVLDDKYPDADPIKIPDREKLAKQLARFAAAALQLHVRGSNVWVSSPTALVRYDWSTGKPAQELALEGGLGGALSRGDEMLLVGEGDSGGKAVIHINLTTGQKRVEELSESAKALVAAAADKGKAGNGKSLGSASAKTQAEVIAGSNKSLNPDQIAAQAQNLPIPGRIALPATLSVARNQDRAMQELRGDSGKPSTAPAGKPVIAEQFALIPGEDDFAEFSVTLLEEKIVSHSAMKARPKKSALDGNVNQAATADIANEFLNDMKRDAGDDTVTEDVSRYAVAVRLPCVKNAAEWRGEVIGEPSLHPLKTVNVITAGKSVTVLDKANKKKWNAALTYAVSDGAGAMDEDDAPFGLGPCVERGDTLYVIDQGVLSAFDLATGNARWRLPSVGIAGMFFDSDGMIYLNTTTASPEKLKYSKQIDVTDKVSAVVMKLDPKTGKTLWTAEPGGLISHLSGKFIYTLQSYQPFESDTENPYMPSTGLERLPQMRIKRINPKNGKVMWTYFQERAPLDVQFDKNTIQLVFKKEVQVLKFISF